MVFGVHAFVEPVHLSVDILDDTHQLPFTNSLNKRVQTRRWEAGLHLLSQCCYSLHWQECAPQNPSNIDAVALSCSNCSNQIGILCCPWTPLSVWFGFPPCCLSLEWPGFSRSLQIVAWCRHSQASARMPWSAAWYPCTESNTVVKSSVILVVADRPCPL